MALRSPVAIRGFGGHLGPPIVNSQRPGGGGARAVLARVGRVAAEAGVGGRILPASGRAPAGVQGARRDTPQAERRRGVARRVELERYAARRSAGEVGEDVAHLARDAALPGVDGVGGEAGGRSNLVRGEATDEHHVEDLDAAGAELVAHGDREGLEHVARDGLRLGAHARGRVAIQVLVQGRSSVQGLRRGLRSIEMISFLARRATKLSKASPRLGSHCRRTRPRSAKRAISTLCVASCTSWRPSRRLELRERTAATLDRITGVSMVTSSRMALLSPSVARLIRSVTGAGGGVLLKVQVSANILLRGARRRTGATRDAGMTSAHHVAPYSGYWKGRTSPSRVQHRHVLRRLRAV